MSTTVKSGRETILRVALVVVVVLASAWLALYDGRAAAPLAPSEELTPLPTDEPRCRLHGAEALAHARVLEQMANARWERVPFALREAPRAAVQVAEAEACYAAANEREGRLRSASKRRAYEAEVQRRFARARLLLRAATLREEAPERVAEAEAHAHQQVVTLLALLNQAPASAESYRARLTELDREYAASAAERARTIQEEP